MRVVSADKDTDVVAEDTQCANALRQRLKIFADSVGIVACEEADGPKTYEGALAMVEAMSEAVNLSSHAQVSGALKTAMAKARRVRNVPGSTTSIGDAFKLGAEVIHSRNDDAVPVAVTKRRNEADAGGSTNETMTLGDIESFIKAARQGDGKGSAKTAATKTVDIEVNGVKKPYKVVQGGNRGCPVACTKMHAKGAMCAWNHNDK